MIKSGEEYKNMFHMSCDTVRRRRIAKPSGAMAAITTSGRNRGSRTIDMRSNGERRNPAIAVIPSGTQQNARNST